MLYFDYAATSPMKKEALDVYIEAARCFSGNTSSPHDEGTRASLLLEQCRTEIASLAGVLKDGIYFTGSGTEGNILALLSFARNKPKKHIITGMAEHTSVHSAMTILQSEGFNITKLPLNEYGVVTVESVKAAICSDTALISIQHINPEIGTIQPVEQIAVEAKKRGILFHTDCVQSFGKVPLHALHADAMTFSAHKIGGPKGCGAVYLSPFQSVSPVFPGLMHEKGIRGGTVDTPAIAAFAEAAKTAASLEKLWTLRHLLKEKLNGSSIKWIEGNDSNQYPGVIGMCIPGIEGQLVMLALNAQNMYISTGSACDASSATGMKAALAMGMTIEEARQFFRLSFGPETTESEVIKLAQALLHVAAQAVML
ncbi:cysteine desulfurase [Domibacillus iocasae]|uniref:Cysteine desulfurase n=1 Tax=Domibacillus iocasae TaxID=1714016 RepID=A0A1E7DNK5_9BACI|nr:IscS subfamily cysteine desulfurase [Domibacillus iocasae]OES44651.1 cysteine desulfurase [Domibacillus iocasae]